MGALEAQAWPCAAKRPLAVGTARRKAASGAIVSLWREDGVA